MSLALQAEEIGADEFSFGIKLEYSILGDSLRGVELYRDDPDIAPRFDGAHDNLLGGWEFGDRLNEEVTCLSIGRQTCDGIAG